VITDSTRFPFKVFDADFLKQANDMFQFWPKIKPTVDQLVGDSEVKKAFMYLFWVYFGFRFQSSTFTETGARPWHSRR